MKEPERLRLGRGPARELMTGSVLHVPSGARQRALQFTGVAVGVTATGTAAAAAGATSIVKSLVLSVSLGAVGGGVLSLAVSETYSRFESSPAHVAPAPAPSVVPRAPGSRGAPVATPTLGVVEPSPPPASVASTPLEGASVEPELRVPPSKTRVEAPLEAPPSASVGEFRDLPQRSSLFEEQRIIESARAAVARGDASSALATLDGYEHRYAQKQFGPEALALRVQALAAKGQQGAARTLAEDFEQRYPHHPLLGRVQSAVGR